MKTVEPRLEGKTILKAERFAGGYWTLTLASGETVGVQRLELLAEAPVFIEALFPPDDVSSQEER